VAKSDMTYDLAPSATTQLTRLSASPLRRVACAIHFAPLLRIADATGAGIAVFQDRIRAEYPTVTLEHSHEIELIADENGTISDPKLSKLPIWRFGSSDGRWRVSLTTQSLAVEIEQSYDGRKALVDRFISLVDALHDAYAPIVYQLLGFRFYNLFDGDKLEAINDYIRSDLLNLRVAPSGFLISSTFSRALLETARGHLMVQYGVAPVGTQTDMQLTPLTEASWILDIDGKMPVDTLTNSDQLREAATEVTDAICRFFGWAVTDRFIKDHRYDGEG
jgi:uncharacterized protein (TIGR04255 family)